MAGRPWAALGMLLAAAVWALGTQQMRRTRLASPTLALGWWMTIATTIVMGLLAFVFERDAWSAPSSAVWFAILFNAVLIFGVAQPLWLVLARDLPPAASTLSVMLIPVLGTFSGAWLLNERVPLAGRRRHRADAGGDRIGAVAGDSHRKRRLHGRGRHSDAASASVRIFESKPSSTSLSALPSSRFGVVLMIHALRMQRAVNQQVRVVGLPASMPCSAASRRTTGAHRIRSATTVGRAL